MADTVERVNGITNDQRKTILTLSDDALDQMHSKIVDYFGEMPAVDEHDDLLALARELNDGLKMQAKPTGVEDDDPPEDDPLGEEADDPLA